MLYVRTNPVAGDTGPESSDRSPAERPGASRALKSVLTVSVTAVLAPATIPGWLQVYVVVDGENTYVRKAKSDTSGDRVAIGRGRAAGVVRGGHVQVHRCVDRQHDRVLLARGDARGRRQDEVHPGRGVPARGSRRRGANGQTHVHIAATIAVAVQLEVGQRAGLARRERLGHGPISRIRGWRRDRPTDPACPPQQQPAQDRAQEPEPAWPLPMPR